MALSDVLPDSWRTENGCARLAGVELTALADCYGTPAYVVDESHVRARLAAYREAFGPATTLVYAGKAFLCRAFVTLLNETDWWVDVVSAGELEVTRRGGMAASRVLMHGNAKSAAEIASAVGAGIGRVVVDNPGELESLADAAAGCGKEVRVLLRLNADVAAVTHPKVKTTGLGAQFGMEVRTAGATAADMDRWPSLRLTGIHIHVGSQIRDLDTYRRAAQAAVAFVEPHRGRFGDSVELDLGGGLAVPYLRTDPTLTPSALADAIAEGLDAARAGDRIGAYRLMVEPGRSVIANAGVTLYRVQARKRLPEGRELVAVDGGMSDNPRPALYGARYEVICVERPNAVHDRRFRVVGRHCETGDVVSDGALLPSDTAPGELLAVPATGAYGYSMSSRYNGVGRPPVLFVHDGRAREVIRRESWDDLHACDLG